MVWSANGSDAGKKKKPVLQSEMNEMTKDWLRHLFASNRDASYLASSDSFNTHKSLISSREGLLSTSSALNQQPMKL